jgi:hypothetical protein
VTARYTPPRRTTPEIVRRGPAAARRHAPPGRRRAPGRGSAKRTPKPRPSQARQSAAPPATGRRSRQAPRRCAPKASANDEGVKVVTPPQDVARIEVPPCRPARRLDIGQGRHDPLAPKGPPAGPPRTARRSRCASRRRSLRRIAPAAGARDAPHAPAPPRAAPSSVKTDAIQRGRRRRRDRPHGRRDGARRSPA